LLSAACTHTRVVASNNGGPAPVHAERAPIVVTPTPLVGHLTVTPPPTTAWVYPPITIVAGIARGRVLVGPQVRVPCRDWTLVGTVGNLRGVQRPIDEPSCADEAWKWIPTDAPRFTVRYRGVEHAYAVTTGSRVTVSGVGSWWVMPDEFLYAQSTRESSCERVDQLVAQRGGSVYTPPSGPPLPRLSDAADPPGPRAQLALMMLTSTRPCHRVYLLRATDDDLQNMAQDATCHGAVTDLVRTIPQGTPLVGDPAACASPGSRSLVP
jgi:hypothetical protein